MSEDLIQLPHGIQLSRRHKSIYAITTGSPIILSSPSVNIRSPKSLENFVKSVIDIAERGDSSERGRIRSLLDAMQSGYLEAVAKYCNLSGGEIIETTERGHDYHLLPSSHFEGFFRGEELGFFAFIRAQEGEERLGDWATCNGGANGATLRQTIEGSRLDPGQMARRYGKTYERCALLEDLPYKLQGAFQIDPAHIARANRDYSNVQLCHIPRQAQQTLQLQSGFAPSFASA